MSIERLRERMQPAFRGATADELRSIEEKFSVVLPDDYKEFLKLLNGGNVDDGVYASEWPTIEAGIESGETLSRDGTVRLNWLSVLYGAMAGELLIKSLPGIPVSPYRYDLSASQSAYDLPIWNPPGFVAVGDFECGYFLVLSCRAEDYGQVYLSLVEDFFDESLGDVPGSGRRVHVADSWTSLVNDVFRYGPLS